jgi:hypothetical protein
MMAIRNRKLLTVLRIAAVVFLIFLAYALRRSMVRDHDDWGSIRAAQAAAADGPPTNRMVVQDTGSGPHIAGCPILPADNVWNTRVDKLPLDKHSAAYIAKMGPAMPLFPDFGSDPDNGIPITIIRYNTPRVLIPFDYHDESDLGKYPVPPNVPLEGGGKEESGDNHTLLIDKDRCELYELGGMRKQPDGSWIAGAGIMVDLTSNQLRGEGKTSTDAAGLPVLPGLVRYDEVAAGEIKHAIRFTTPKTQHAYIWPARHQASRLTDVSYPPMGARFRLRADVDISKYSKENQVILTALKRYGMILSDNGSAWFIIGAPDSRWNDSDLRKLKTIRGEDFEAVDESDWPFLYDSGRVDPMALK